MMGFVSWDDDIPNICKNKKCSKPAYRMLKYYGNVIDVVKPLRLLKNINEHRKHQRGIVPTFRMDSKKNIKNSTAPMDPYGEMVDHPKTSRDMSQTDPS